MEGIRPLGKVREAQQFGLDGVRRVGTYAFTEVAEVLRGGYDKPQPPQVGVLIHMHPMESNVIDAI